MKLPTMGENNKLQSDLENTEAKDVVSVYQKFFAGLGFPIEAQSEMDSQDFLKFIEFVLNPKKNSNTGT